MKVKQFREVLEKTARIHARLGASATAATLRSLASALEAHDNATVQKFVSDVQKLWATRKQESADGL